MWFVAMKRLPQDYFTATKAVYKEREHAVWTLIQLSRFCKAPYVKPYCSNTL